MDCKLGFRNPVRSTLKEVPLGILLLARASYNHKAKGKLGKRGGFSSEQMQLLTPMIFLVLQLTRKGREVERIRHQPWIRSSLR